MIKIIKSKGKIKEIVNTVNFSTSKLYISPELNKITIINRVNKILMMLQAKVMKGHNSTCKNNQKSYFSEFLDKIVGVKLKTLTIESKLTK